MTDRYASHPTGPLERDVDDRLILDDRAAERDDLLAARRRQDFAYLATLALLVLRGEAKLGAPVPIRESRGGSYIAHFDGYARLDDEHKLCLQTPVRVEYPTGEPRELAEALLVELTREA